MPIAYKKLYDPSSYSIQPKTQNSHIVHPYHKTRTERARHIKENAIVSIHTQNIFHCAYIRPYNYQHNVQTVPAYTPTHCAIEKNFRKTIEFYLDVLFRTSFPRTKTK